MEILSWHDSLLQGKLALLHHLLEIRQDGHKRSGDGAVELNQGSDGLLSMEPRENVKHRRRDSCELYAELCDFTGRNQGWLSALFLLVCRILLCDLERSNSGDGVWGEVAGYTRPVKKKKKKKEKRQLEECVRVLSYPDQFISSAESVAA